MPIFQLDENLNDSEFARECDEESKAAGIADLSLKRFPKRLRGEEDEVVLRNLLSSGGTVLTKDRGIATDGKDGIPDEHPGIIIIANAPSVRVTGNQAVRQILRKMKTSVNEWHSLSFKNSIIEITQAGIEVRRKSDAKAKYLDFAANGWESNLVSILKDNAGQN